MPVPPKRLKNLIEGTVDYHASVTFPDLQEVTIRWRGSSGYLTAWAGEGDDDDECKARHSKRACDRPPTHAKWCRCHWDWEAWKCRGVVFG